MYRTLSICILFALLPSLLGLHAKRDIQKIAIIDTGLDIEDERFKSHICGYKDFTNTGIQDTLGHGTHVAGLIRQYAGNASYCLIILKYYSEEQTGEQNANNLIMSIKEAGAQGASIVNISGGGESYSEKEYWNIKQNPKVTFIVAAGNESKDIDKRDNEFYPASYKLPNIVSVGCLKPDSSHCATSNYGNSVKIWELGYEVLSTLPHNRIGRLTGTSMSTAIHTGKVIKERD